MLLKIIWFSVILLGEVKSNELSNAKWTDMDNKVIKVPEYCERNNKKCLVKCCGKGYFINGNRCTYALNPSVRETKLNFSNIHVYNIDNSTTINTGVRLDSAFVFVRNYILSDLNRTISMGITNDTYILEDGSLKFGDSDGVYKEFCVDFVLTAVISKTDRRFKFTARVLALDASEGKIKHIFVMIGLSISIFFCILVLVVYSLLPVLRSLPGLIMMAYLSTFIGTGILKIVQLACLNAEVFSRLQCVHFSPAIYFIILATFLWLNVMSIEVWRLPRKSSRGYRVLTSGELRKFYLYCVYAWGLAALLTLLVVAVDRFKLYTSDKFKPPFESCFREEKLTQIYLYVPIGIIIVTNIILFAMAAYQIWIVKGKISNNTESRTSKQTESRFITCLKIFVLTGVSWILELVPSSIPFALYIVLNFYNLFVGIAIFYVLVCKKRILFMLCTKLNINNSFVNRLQPSQYQPGTTQSTRLTVAIEKEQLNTDGSADQQASQNNHRTKDEKQ